MFGDAQSSHLRLLSHGRVGVNALSCAGARVRALRRAFLLACRQIHAARAEISAYAQVVTHRIGCVCPCARAQINWLGRLVPDAVRRIAAW
eukprot:6193888-Pleurochrysis_carterae.AAC.2